MPLPSSDLTDKNKKLLCDFFFVSTIDFDNKPTLITNLSSLILMDSEKMTRGIGALLVLSRNIFIMMIGVVLTLREIHGSFIEMKTGMECNEQHA
jgi:hypothetical protein